jgi:spermidine/putrescine-binding protein
MSMIDRMVARSTYRSTQRPLLRVPPARHSSDVPAIRMNPMSRRSLLFGFAAGAALTGCGVPAAYVKPGERARRDDSERDRSVDFANWPLYIDTDDEDTSERPTLSAFTERTGISVRYTEEINDNDEFFGKISPALMNHQETGRDLIVVSDWMAARFVRLGWVQEMDGAKQPNVAKYLDPQLRSPAFDDGRLHSVPWQSGITGIAYNRRKLGREIQHTDDLWADDLRGKVTLLSGLDESFALLMQGNGVDVTRWTADDFHTVCEQVERLVKAKHIRRFAGGSFLTAFAGRSAAAEAAWATSRACSVRCRLESWVGHFSTGMLPPINSRSTGRSSVSAFGARPLLRSSRMASRTRASLKAGTSPSSGRPVQRSVCQSCVFGSWKNTKHGSRGSRCMTYLFLFFPPRRDSSPR